MEIDVKFEGHPVVSFFIKKDGKPKVTLYVGGILSLAAFVFTLLRPILGF